MDMSWRIAEMFDKFCKSCVYDLFQNRNNKKEKHDIFDHCCLTLMAWAPGAHCSHGFFFSFFPPDYILLASHVDKKKKMIPFFK